MKRTTLFILCFLALTILAGCLSSVPVNPQIDLEKRINALWKAKTNGDWKRVYTFFDENYQNKTPKSRFELPKKINIAAYAIENIQMDKTNKKAKVIIFYDMINNGTRVKKLKAKENWIVEKGNWVLHAVPKTPGLL